MPRGRAGYAGLAGIRNRFEAAIRHYAMGPSSHPVTLHKRTIDALIGVIVSGVVRASMTWVELPGGTSIVFDLRIAALAGESEAETNNRFVAEAIRIAGSFLLELGR
jgi:hypothetical protein